MRNSKKRQRTTKIIVAISALSLLVIFYINKLSTSLFAATPTSTSITSDVDFSAGELSAATIINSGDAAHIELQGEPGPDDTAYVRTLEINNPNSNAQTEYQVLVEFDSATIIGESKLQNDCDDLRFTNSSGDSLPYYLLAGTCNTTATQAWVQVDLLAASSSTTIKMYYGSPSAAKGSDIEATFSYSTEKDVAYVLDSLVNDLQVISFANENTVSHNGSTLSFTNKGDKGSFNSIDRYAPISAKKPFNSDDSSEDTDGVVPVSWAGTDFYFFARSSNPTFYMIAPWGNATADIIEDGTLRCNDHTVSQSGSTFTCGGSSGTYNVTTDIPVLLFVDMGSTDPMPVHPATTDPFLGASRSTLVMSGPQGADYRYIESDATSEQNPGNLGAVAYDNLSGGSFASSPAFKAWSVNYPVGVHQYADGDGSDASPYHLASEAGTTWGSANNTDYIAIVSEFPATCTVYNPSGTQLYTGTATSSNSQAYYLGFGTGSSSVLINGGWYMDCDMPVVVNYQKNSGSEAGLQGQLDMRQFTYPTPVMTGISDEATALSPVGTWETDDDANVIDLVWNGGWGDGTDDSTALEADVSDVDSNSAVTIQMRVAESKEDLQNQSYITVLSGSTFTITKSQLDSFGISDGTSRYVQFKATLNSYDGITNPKLNDLTLYYTEDTADPITNADTVEVQGLVEQWTATPPIITWSVASDDSSGSGILGYCISLDETTVDGPAPNNDPETSAGKLQGLIGDVSHDNCPFIVDSEIIDLSSVAGLELSNNKEYYISIKAIDHAGNVYNGGGYQNLGQFKYDSEPPTTVPYIITAGITFYSVNDMSFSWLPDQTSDSESGVLGWQYAINTYETWKGTDYDADLDIDYIPYDNALTSFTLDETEDGDDFREGSNLVYFRAVDKAGNTSPYVTGGLIWGGDAPVFPQGSHLTVTPQTNTENEYALAWPAANPVEGVDIESYYYMVNRQPPVTLQTLQSNSTYYIPTNDLSIEADQLFGAIKGVNTVCIAVADTDGNYSPTNSLCTEFTLNSSVPDPVSNLLATDSSLKANELWRSTLTWDLPSYKGDGNLTYIIERSSDNESWSNIATTKGLAYTDTVQDSDLYYYRVGVTDTSDESKDDPTFAESVSILPEGSFDYPAELTKEPEITSLTTRTAVIEWQTDRESDSKIQYGKTPGVYFDEEPSKGDQVISHEITLINLDPGTTYYFRAKWTDEDGNTGYSEEMPFTTNPAPVVTDPKVSGVGLSFVNLEFTVENATRAKVYYGKTDQFGAVSEIATSLEKTKYFMRIDGLDDGSNYFYKINPFDEEGVEFEGNVLSFQTVERPKVATIRIQQIKNTAQPTILLTWETNTPTSSIVSYQPVDGSSDRKTEIDTDLIKGEHKMIIRGLLAETQYRLEVTGKDLQGNAAVSSPQVFTTATDTRPPEITNLRIESVILNNDSDGPTAQLLVSWDTDEPATSQIEFGEGSGTTYTQRSVKDSNFTVNHLVVVSGLKPSSVYHLRAISEDSAVNIAETDDNVTITQKATDSAFDLAVSSLRDIFGFIGGF